MGAFPKHSGVGLESQSSPNPLCFTIDDVFFSKRNCAIQVTYPNCTNYEGKKILVFRNMTKKRLRAIRSLDPHFSREPNSPFARFEPTPLGWKLARSLCRQLGEMFDEQK